MLTSVNKLLSLDATVYVPNCICHIGLVVEGNVGDNTITLLAFIACMHLKHNSCHIRKIKLL